MRCLQPVLQIQNFYPGFRIPDSGFNFSIPDPGWQDPGSGSAWKNISIPYLTQKTGTKFSKIKSGMFIPDPRFFPSRIRGSKKHWSQFSWGCYGLPGSRSRSTEIFYLDLTQQLPSLKSQNVLIVPHLILWLLSYFHSSLNDRGQWPDHYKKWENIHLKKFSRMGLDQEQQWHWQMNRLSSLKKI
jgi:hypothetical protein